MSTYGADLDQLAILARTMAKAGETVGQAFAHVRDELRNTPWSGPDADRFRSEWSANGKGLNEASEVLQKLAVHLLQEADEQRVASGGLAQWGATREGTGMPMSLHGSPDGLHRLLNQFGQSGTPTTGAQAFDKRLSVESLLTPLTAEMPRLLRGESLLSDLKPDASTLLRALDGRSASSEASFDAAKEWNFRKAGTAAWGPYDIEAKAGIGAEGTISATASIQDGQLRAAFDAGVKLGAYAEVSATTEIGGVVPVGIHGEAMAGAEGDVAGRMLLGEDGVRASLQGEGFIGARAGGEGELKLGDYGAATVGGEAWAGAGVEAGADADVGWDNVGFDAQIGIGLGVGAKISFGFAFSPEDIADDAVSAATGVAKRTGSVIKNVGSAAWDAGSDAWDSISPF